MSNTTENDDVVDLQAERQQEPVSFNEWAGWY